MPGDYDAEYASPWAGANFLPVSKKGTDAAEWDRNTWRKGILIEQNIGLADTVIYSRTKDASKVTADWLSGLLSTDPWFKDMVPDVVPKEKLAPGIDSATTFKSVTINTVIYLPWLASQCLKNKVVIKRAILKHISEAKSLHHSGRKADVVVNCTGLLASRLGGVMDKNVIPARGQTVLVRNDPGIMPTISGTDDGDDEVTYIIPRPAGGGTILGGSYEKGRWESQPDPNLAQRIMKRSVELAPALTDGKGVEALSIIRHGVGLRPLRIGGVRLEKEKIDGVWIVHNYGHGGFGYSQTKRLGDVLRWL
ncbi:hypothetical protein GP486_002170 [Trichoglossum hirsutum]|uniref:D-amino-acid oxidase n=1 Tax=Trichoglossum hirsutum TaxID=265104 RepID=A0A9P8RSD4_9PEZI|nr:hypothetical protein GP486_002170 [Trichoglossum hirsutum]